MMKYDPMPNAQMNLQFFAVDAEQPADTQPPANAMADAAAQGFAQGLADAAKANQSTDPEPKEPRTFSQADIDRIIQRHKAGEQARIEKAVSDALTEAQRLANLTADQRAEEERRKAEQSLRDRELAITTRELRAQAYETLSERGLPRELAECLNYADADKCMGSIDAVEAAWRKAVQAGVDDRLKGQAPRSAQGQVQAAPAPTVQGRIQQELGKLQSLNT